MSQDHQLQQKTNGNSILGVKIAAKDILCAAYY